jgi:hypothetical protein
MLRGVPKQTTLNLFMCSLFDRIITDKIIHGNGYKGNLSVLNNFVKFSAAEPLWWNAGGTKQDEPQNTRNGAEINSKKRNSNE